MTDEALPLPEVAEPVDGWDLMDAERADALAELGIVPE
jgi:hypothetical protein